MTAIPMPLPFQPPAKARSPFTAVTTSSRAPATGRSGEMYATPEWEARLLRLPPLTLTKRAWIRGRSLFAVAPSAVRSVASFLNWTITSMEASGSTPFRSGAIFATTTDWSSFGARAGRMGADFIDRNAGVAKISLIRTYRYLSSGRSGNDGCGSDGRSGLGVAGNSPARRFTFKRAILTRRPRMRGQRRGLLPYLSVGATKVARMSPRVVSENSCHEDSARESDERAPSRRFEHAAGGAGSFVATRHGLDLSELDCGPQILSRDPVDVCVLCTASIADRSNPGRWYRGPPGLVLEYRWFCVPLRLAQGELHAGLVNIL